MFKRLTRLDRRKEPQISSPVLVETSFDEKVLEDMANVSEAQNSQHRQHEYRVADTRSSQSTSARQHRPGTDVNIAHRDQVVSMAPTESSVYSQPALPASSRWTQPYVNTSQSYYGDVSPPSSPIDGESRNGPHSGEVSPVEIEAPIFSHARKSSLEKRSQIPVLRKVNLPPEESFPRLRNKIGKGPTRWDKYTGEITTKESGKLGSSYNSNAPVFKLKPTGLLKNSTYQQKDTAGHNRTSSHVLNDAGPSLASPTADARPPWKGASGRAAIVEPVADGPIKSTPIPQRKASLAGETHEDFVPENESTAITTAEPPVTRIVAETNPASPPSAESTPKLEAHAFADIKPVVPLKAGNNVPKRIQTPRSPISGDSRASSAPITAQTDGHASSPSQNPSPPLTPIPLRKAIPRKSVDTSSSSPYVNADPASRFSWTTLNTNQTYQSDSPSSSPAPPPVPSLPIDYSPPPAQVISPAPTSHPQSIMNRTRPVPREDYSPTSSVRSRASTIRDGLSEPFVVEQLPDYAPPEWTFGKPYSPSIAPSIASTNAPGKLLPPPPTALSAESLIDELQARLDDLATQRRNIQRIIADHNATQPQNPIVSDLRARREADKKMAVWTEELEEIHKAEHNTGLRLHRAWRRKERLEGADGSALWIKRVTS